MASIADLPHSFRNRKLLEDALDPRSDSNRRLEWIGDRALGCAISAILLKDHPDRDVGDLTAAYTRLVNNHRLAAIGKGMDLPGSESAPLSNVRAANTVEAVIGAVYLDGGMEAAHRCVRWMFDGILKKEQDDLWFKDPKTLLKEHCETSNAKMPVYYYAEHAENGAFMATCEAMNVIAKGVGKTKGAAATVAASSVMDKLSAIATKKRKRKQAWRR